MISPLYPCSVGRLAFKPPGIRRMPLWNALQRCDAFGITGGLRAARPTVTLYVYSPFQNPPDFPVLRR